MSRTASCKLSVIADRGSAVKRPAVSRAPLWLMVAALTSIFAMSQAYRTLPAIVANAIEAEFHLSAQAIGFFAGAFHLSFGLMQLFVGVALDRYGPKWTVTVFFSVGVLGAILCAAAPNFALLITGQILLGIGSAPAFLAVLLFIAQAFPPNRFTSISGYAMSFGGLGMLATATPLAFVVQTWSWRASFILLAIASTLALIIAFVLVRERPSRAYAKSESLADAFRQAALLFKAPQTAGILILGAITYSSLLALRGLWIVPLFVQRHDFTLVQTGNVVLILSVAMLLSPMLFGRIDPGVRWRRPLIVTGALVSAALILILGWAEPRSAAADIVLTLVIGLVSGFIILQYADVRASYPQDVAGRALAIFTMAMFLGVALVQWLTGLVAGFVIARGQEPLFAVHATLAILLVAASTAFVALPRAPMNRPNAART
jgi:predicted MFS family arabinose efflux permease